MQNTFDFGPDEEPQLLEDGIARRLVRTGSLLCAVSAVFFAAMYAWRGPVEFSAPHIAAAAILLAIWAFPVRTSTAPIYLAVTVALLLFGYQLVLLGRIDNGIAMWFLVPFVATMMLGMRRLAIFCGTLTVVEICGVVAAARIGWLHSRVVLPEADLVMAISVLAVMTLLGMFAVITLRARRVLMRELSLRNAALGEALEEARLARNVAIEAAQAKERLYANLSAANKELETFAYSISHDLRAPLRGIDGFSHMLSEEYGDLLDAQGKGYLDRVRAAAQRMGTLIDDILELSRVSRHSMRHGQVNLSQLAQEVLDELAQASPASTAETVIEEGCIAFGDPQLLRILMQNLLENAWKYSGREPAPKIEFGRETRDGEPLFFVRDNGVGFDMKYADRLFSPFQRLHKPEEFEGTGIGLATVARIVQGHGGRVWAESEPGKGTTLRFTLSEGGE